MHPVDESAGDDMWKAFVAADAAVVAPVELEDRLFDALQTTEHCARPHSYRSMIGSVGLAAAVLLMTISSWPRSHVDRADRLARYAGPNVNFVPLVYPHNGLGARSAPKPTTRTSQRASPPGYQGQSPWLVTEPLVGLTVTFEPAFVGFKPQVVPQAAFASSARLQPRRAPSNQNLWAVTDQLPPALLSLGAGPVREAEALQLVRLRLPREALQGLGLALIEPDAAAVVDIDVLIGEDGLARDIRQVRSGATGAQP